MRKKPPRHPRPWAVALGQRRAARARCLGAWERVGRRWAPWAPAPPTGRVACPKSWANQRHREATVNTRQSTQRSVRAIDSEAARAATRADASLVRGDGRAARTAPRGRGRGMAKESKENFGEELRLSPRARRMQQTWNLGNPFVSKLSTPICLTKPGLHMLRLLHNLVFRRAREAPCRWHRRPCESR